MSAIPSKPAGAGRYPLVRDMILRIAGQHSVARHAHTRGDAFTLQTALEEIVLLAETALLAVAGDREAAVERFRAAVSTANAVELARAAELEREPRGQS